MMSADAAEIGRRFFEGQDKAKGALPAELCAPDYTATINENPALSLAGHSQFGKMFYKAFPDLRHEILESIGTDDRAVVRFRLHGTNSAEFMGIPATGKTISVLGTVVMRIENGKIKELHGLFDQLSMLGQLGVMSS